MIILLVVLKKLTDIFKEISHNIDVQRSKKTSQPLKCRRLKKSISQTFSMNIEKNEKEKKAKEEKDKEEKEKEKERRRIQRRRVEECKGGKEREKNENEEKEKEKKAK